MNCRRKLPCRVAVKARVPADGGRLVSFEACSRVFPDPMFWRLRQAKSLDGSHNLEVTKHPH